MSSKNKKKCTPNCLHCNTLLTGSDQYTTHYSPNYRPASTFDYFSRRKRRNSISSIAAHDLVQDDHMMKMISVGNYRIKSHGGGHVLTFSSGQVISGGIHFGGEMTDRVTCFTWFLHTLHTLIAECTNRRYLCIIIKQKKKTCQIADLMILSTHSNVHTACLPSAMVQMLISNYNDESSTQDVDDQVHQICIYG